MTPTPVPTDTLPESSKMIESMLYHSGDPRKVLPNMDQIDLENLVATAKAEGVKEGIQQERKRIKKWLNDNQLLETKELGKIVLWGWIYQVVSYPDSSQEGEQ